MKIPIKSIKVPEKRQRTEFTEAGISSLAASLAKVGQLHPIYIVRLSDHADAAVVLVSGYRRLMAAKKLGWEEIWAEETTKADPLELEEIELDENLQRENLSWQEEVAAKKRLMDLRTIKYGDDFRAVADHVGESRGGFWEDVKIAEALAENPELASSKNKTQAMNKIRLAKRREGLIEKAGHFDESLMSNYSGKVKFGDCLTLMKGWYDGCAQLIVTDPPYGINLDVGETKKGNPHPTVYSDDPGATMDLVYLVAKECYRLLVSDAHAYFFFDIKAYPTVFTLLSDVGFLVDPIPLIWVKNQSGQVNHPDSRFGSAYEACFFCRKGSRALLKQGASNVLKIDCVPPNKKIHPTEKPVELLQALIEFSSVPGETVVDPFGGSGSTAEAAIRTGRNFLTCEKDPGYHAGILERLAKLERAAKVGVSVSGMSEDEASDWGIE